MQCTLTNTCRMTEESSQPAGARRAKARPRPVLSKWEYPLQSWSPSFASRSAMICSAAILSAASFSEADCASRTFFSAHTATQAIRAKPPRLAAAAAQVRFYVAYLPSQSFLFNASSAAWFGSVSASVCRYSSVIWERSSSAGGQCAGHSAQPGSGRQQQPEPPQHQVVPCTLPRSRLNLQQVK